MVWRQKSHELWLKAGDRNLKFFHASTIANRRRIFIAALRNDEGQWFVSRDSIGNNLCSQFTNLFRADDTIQCPSLNQFIYPCIRYNENEGIMDVPSFSKIFTVFKNLHPSKSPGPDGMPAVFFQKLWNIVGLDVCNVIQNVFRPGRLPKALNRTFVVLIPKVKLISKFNHIQPICLCNTICKVISKILACRLKPLMPCIISPN